MATSRILVLMRRSWTAAGFMFAALLAEAIALLHTVVAWRAPEGSAVFRPWSALTGVRETGRLFLLLDQENRHVRGFVPKESSGGLPPDPGLGDLIRERISAGAP